jgi:hypothetical protein
LLAKLLLVAFQMTSFTKGISFILEIIPADIEMFEVSGKEITVVDLVF